jgi:hypothetical protein
MPLGVNIVFSIIAAMLVASPLMVKEITFSHAILNITIGANIALILMYNLI